MNDKMTTYPGTQVWRNKAGHWRKLGLSQQAAGLLLIVIFTCAGWLVPGTSGGATDVYSFQNVAVSDVCTGTSTINQSGEANVPAGGSLVSSDNYQTGGWYHFNWDAGATTAATSLANDIYTAPFTTTTKITALKLKMDHTFSYNPVGYVPPANMYVKFFDVDGNAPCPGFEQGTLIAQTAESTWLLFNQAPKNSTLSVDNIYYTIQPGHRIRVELWNNFATNKNLQVRYGPGTSTGLSVDYLPPPPDPAPTPNTTINAGTAPASVTIAPGAAPVILHNFTLQTSSGTDRIDGITVGLTPYTSVSVVGSLSITNDAGNYYYKSGHVPTSDFGNIPLYYAIYPTTAPSQYRVLIAPKSHAEMPAPPGAMYTIAGTVEGINSLSAPPYTGISYDAANSTVTIDNLSPATPIWGTSTAGDSTVNLNWTNPADTDFHSVVVLRGTAAVTATPAEGATYTAGNTIGSSTVVYAGNLQTFTDGLADILWNGTTYYYRIFARDVNGNYSLGAAAGPFTPLQSGTGTVTVGDGTNPANSVVGIVYSDPVTLDAFTLTSWPPVHLTSVSVTFPPGTASYLSQVYLTNAGDTIIRNATPTADTVVLSGLNLTLSNTLSSFKIKISQKSSSPPPAGTEATITGTITALTIDEADMNIVYNDTASATVTYDHKAPANPVLQYANPADGNVDMRWTDPADADTYGTLILRNTVPVTDAPQDGNGYTGYNGNIGASLLVHNSRFYTPLSVETLNWSTAVNGTPYYYKLFARDARHNYSTGLAVGPVTPDVTVTVGNGTEPANAIVAPGSNAVATDNFTLASTSSASVDSITVTLSSGALDVVDSVRIASGNGATVYGSVTNPAAETVTIPTTGITATTSAANYRVEITPKIHTGMSPVPGTAVEVAGVVTTITTPATSYKTYNDTTSATVTVDNQSPANPAGVAVIPLDGGFNVSWINPADADFSSILALRNTVPVTEQPIEGMSYTAGASIGTSTVAYEGSQQTFIERGLTNGANYYYRLFARDSHGNYSAVGSQIGPLAPLPSNRTVAGDASAAMQGLDAINVSMPYTDDANGNGTCAVEYKLSTSSTWLPWTTGVSRAAGNCTATITGLEKGLRYDVRMTHDDSDGVLGTASQTVTGIVALSLIQTNAGNVTAAFDPNYAGPTTIVVMAQFTNDYNQNNSCTLEYKKSSDSDWMPGSEIYLQSAGTYFGFIYDLQLLTRYDVRLTFIDPDGVNGEAVRIFTGVISPSQKNPKLVHNSINVVDINDPTPNNYWGPMGWGIPGGMYGEFTCMTCHTRQPTPNASAIRTSIMGSPVLFKGTTGPYSFGDDSGATTKPDWQTGTYMICQVCHTQTYGRIGYAEVEPGVWEPYYGPIHRNTMSEPSNHAMSNGQDCTQCHPHDNGFGVRMGP